MPSVDQLAAADGVVSVNAGGGAAITFHRRGHVTEAELVTTDPAATGARSVDPPVGEVGHPPDGARPDPEVVSALAAALVELAAGQHAAGATVHLAADHPVDHLDPLPEAVADRAGLPHRRDLFELRRPLPVPADHPERPSAAAVATRAFRPGVDDEAWLRVNNAAFADHPDQGRETPLTLADRLAEGWFDPEGFLVADDPERPGELIGFCWTRVHPATADDPALGEIYVIGVAPAHHGRRLGPVLVLAGLDHLAARGIGTADLYVDADNAPARRLYDRLGFAPHHRRRVYTAADDR